MIVTECALAESDQLWNTGRMYFWGPQCDVTRGKFSLDYAAQQDLMSRGPHYAI